MPEFTPKKLDLQRREMPKQEPEVRSRNFSEVALGYTAELAIEEARRCLQCKKPFCVANCPVQIDIPEFIQAIAQGDFRRRRAHLKARNSLPSVCGRVCPQEEQCENELRPDQTQGRDCHWAVGTLSGRLGCRPSRSRLPDGAAASTGKKVAIVGGGPAGLTAAADLVKCGHGWSSLRPCTRWAACCPTASRNFACRRKSSIARSIICAAWAWRCSIDFVVGKTRSIDSLLEEL